MARLFAVIFLLLFISGFAFEANYENLCAKASQQDVVFSSFKRHPEYCGILEHLSEEIGAQYLEFIVEKYPGSISYFDKFRENDSVGDPRTYCFGIYGFFSPTTLRYIKVASDLKYKFGD